MKLFGFLASLFGASSPAAETKLVDPKSILFSTPTLNDALPAFRQSSTPAGKLFEIHEDDWRQFEAVSTTYQDEIKRELTAIRDVLATSSVPTKIGERSPTAFRKVHVRKLIVEPIPKPLLLSELSALASNRAEFAGLSLSGSAPVAGGYALTIDGLVVFGQADRDRVLSLCLALNAVPKIGPEKARKLTGMLRTHDLTIVHWPSATILPLESDFFRFLTGGSAKQRDAVSGTRRTFEDELGKRNVRFAVEQGTGRYRLQNDGTELLVSVENLERDVASDGDLSRVTRFVDTVLTTTVTDQKPLDPQRLFWCFEPNDYVEKADYRKPVSDRIDRVLVLLSADNARITWVTPGMLAQAKLAEDSAGKIAFENLSREMLNTKIEFSEIDGVRLGYLNTTLPFKAALLMAPNLKTCVENKLGWPVMAVAPDRDFLYLWSAKHEKFVNRVGSTTVEQYSKASYPLSTEVYSVSDSGLKAIGEFPSAKAK
jgi:hypothetical protein